MGYANTTTYRQSLQFIWLGLHQGLTHSGTQSGNKKSVTVCRYLGEHSTDWQKNMTELELDLLYYDILDKFAKAEMELVHD